jgi:hypothetical protein
MDCVICERRGGYNRAVVELETGVELGGLCVRCENEKFGELCGELGDPDSDSCVFCDRDGLWALPKWLPSTYESDGRTVSYVDYDVSTTSFHLCDEHLAKVGVDDIAVPKVTKEPEQFITRSTDD